MSARSKCVESNPGIENHPTSFALLNNSISCNILVQVIAIKISIIIVVVVLVVLLEPLFHQN